MSQQDLGPHRRPATLYRWGYVAKGKVNPSSVLGAFSRAIFSSVTDLLLVVASLAWMIFFPILGIVFLVITILAFALRPRRSGLWAGKCPHCNEGITVKRSGAIIAFNCPICVKRLLLKNAEFVAVSDLGAVRE